MGAMERPTVILRLLARAALLGSLLLGSATGGLAQSSQLLPPVPILPPGTTNAEVALTETQALKLENANLRFQLAGAQAQIAAMAKNAVIGQICAELGLVDCQIDPNARMARPVARIERPQVPPRSARPQPAKKTGTQQ